MKFDKEYTEYWASAVEKSVDGTTIAGLNEAKYFLDLIPIKKSDSVLDLGCSFGRMYELLGSYSNNIYGVDPDKYAVQEAKKKSYIEVLQGKAERTGFEDSFFNLIFCWATFDVVDHLQGLKEFNRILKNEGTLLITGKNSNYYDDDPLAFKAEKNAFLKAFPNRFTNLQIFLKNLDEFGLELINIYLFPRRGDFGKLNLGSPNKISNNSYISYEYLIICKKYSAVRENTDSLKKPDQIFSDTSLRLAKEQGFTTAKEMFKSIGLD